MQKNLFRLGLLVLVLGLMAFPAMGQQFQIPIIFTNDATSGGAPGKVAKDTVRLGVNPNNTFGVDNPPAAGGYAEPPAPPFPPDYQLAVQFPTGAGIPNIPNLATKDDYRQYRSSAQVDSFLVLLTGKAGTGSLDGRKYATTISWPSGLGSFGTSWTLSVINPGGVLSGTVNMITSTSATLAAQPSFPGDVYVLIVKVGATAGTPGPTFALNPTSLDFGGAAISTPVVRTVTVSNTGSLNSLSITNVTTIANYTVSPLTATVPAGGSQVFTITFTPPSANTFAGNIVFTHNAPGSPTSLPVTGRGLPAVSFDLSPTSLAFGNVPNGGSLSLPVTVTNGGASTTLSITAVSLPATYTITPSTFPVNVAPGANQVFTVRFAPLDNLAHNGNVTFTHNAPGSPTNLAVTGQGLAQGGSLLFAASPRTRLDRTNNYLDSLQLTYGGAKLKAVQFWLVLKGLTKIRSVTKGASLSDSVTFDYTIANGPLAADSSRNDTVKALFYGIGSYGLAAGTYPNVMKFAYDVVNLTTDSVRTTSDTLINVFSSLGDGTPGGIIGGSQQIIVLNKTRVFRGDINGDDAINIQDLLKIQDHIVGRVLLAGQQFRNADVYPWPNGDGSVNVQDLAVLQNMILTGQYPDGSPITAPVLGGGNTVLATRNTPTDVDARLVFHVTSSGIDVRMVNSVPVRGMQVDFTGLVSAPEPVNITTMLGQGFSHFADNCLRVLLYNQAGYSVLEPGDRIVAHMPFSIDTPAKVRLGELVLASPDANRITNIQTEISLNPTSVADQLPVDYALYQNYPNPFNPSTTITFSVPQSSDVRVSVYNTLGQEVRTLFTGQMDRGTKSLVWDGVDNKGGSVASGMYIARMTAGSFVSSFKMMLLK